MDASAYPMMQNKDFELHDFIDDPNIDQFIDLIQGENEILEPSFGCTFVSECIVDNQIGSTGEDMFGFNGQVHWCLNGDANGGVQEEDNDGDDSSGRARTTTTKCTKKPKVDRSRTLISERRRRGKMKEKLYALRALVPNITKLETVLYVQDLQMKAKKLKTEIADLEASLTGAERQDQESTGNTKKTRVRSKKNPTCKKIMQMGVFQVEKRGFYVRLVCSKGEGVAVSLYQALESLTSFSIQNSNLTTVSEKFVLTFTSSVRGSDQNMHLTNMKLWVTKALVNQGFEVLTPSSA
ncbi:transcription factor FER-LIKE IRON DEFICIENCY-INDUCED TRANSCRIPTION FACTOR [Citrus sinensis]|nr:transcription factor FER-LIKE IRON DEFICIENCY-INDUCED TRANSCRIPTION FACTOR [Citrus sinensis]